MSKKSILLSISILLVLVFAIVGVIFLSSERARAALTGQSTPSVTITAGGSLTVTPTGMAYGSKSAGTHTVYTDDGGHKVAVTVSTNTTTWDVKVSKNQDLTSGGFTINSTDFIYSSVYVSGTPATANVYGPLEFGSVGSPSNVTTTPGTPAKANALVVDVRYDLTIPSTQDAASNYQATHTYTLTAS